ncbi:MAG: sulfotransferase [Acidimicrobiia bacterium]
MKSPKCAPTNTKRTRCRGQACQLECGHSQQASTSSKAPIADIDVGLYLSHILHRYPSEMRQPRGQEVSGRLPTFLIIGAQRSGTTTLARRLGEHPQVFMALRKELEYFDQHYQRGLEWYSSFFATAGEEIQFGEASPSYLFEPIAIRRIADVLPDVRLLVTLRNPVDRAYSHYWHNRARKKETLTFAEALEAEIARTTSDDVSHFRFSYASRGYYAEQLDEVLRHFPRSALHVEIAEETNASPVEALARIYRFLEVDPEFIPKTIDRRFNAHAEFRSVRLWEKSNALPRTLAKLIKRVNRKTNQQYPAMDQETRTRLETMYQESNQRLAAFLGRSHIWPNS